MSTNFSLSGGCSSYQSYCEVQSFTGLALDQGAARVPFPQPILPYPFAEAGRTEGTIQESRCCDFYYGSGQRVQVVMAAGVGAQESSTLTLREGGGPFEGIETRVEAITKRVLNCAVREESLVQREVVSPDFYDEIVEMERILRTVQVRA